MEFLAIIEIGENSYGAYIPDLPGCIAVGETEDEVKLLIKEALEFHLEDMKMENNKIPIPTSKSMTLIV